ncbi:laccase, multicopper oxidase, benzenediol:oxygen oxidorectuctase, partial [Termitomyces sp. T32_za158]
PTGGSPAANPNLNPDLALAILRYKGAPAVEPTTVNVPGVKLFEGDMHVSRTTLNFSSQLEPRQLS